MVYGRKIAGRELSFEPSGALLQASLVMRDRETDSWWSILGSRAIGGALAGTPLDQLPVGEKTTWADWVKRHPDTLVLSVGGVEHPARDPYRSYFSSAETFRSAPVADRRLHPKEPVFAFRHAGQAYAAPFRALAGGATFRLEDGSLVLLYRDPGAALFASTRGYLLRADQVDRIRDIARLLAEVESSPAEPARRLEGLDTFWYTWVGVHPGSRLLGAGSPPGGE